MYQAIFMNTRVFAIARARARV